MTQPINTHLEINQRLCGTPLSLEEGAATVKLVALPEMSADDRGLIHGGFVFGAVDYAAMLAVNHPYVVLGAADVRLTAPAKVGEEIIAHARRAEQQGRRHVLEVRAMVGDREILKGTLTAFVLDQHVLDR